MAEGLFGSAVDFNNTSHTNIYGGHSGWPLAENWYVQLPVTSGSSLDFRKNDFTISLWFLTRANQGGSGLADTLISRGISDQVGDYGRFWCWIDYGQLSCSIANNSYSIPNASHYVNFGTFNLNEWYHLVFIKKSDSISIYKQGSLVQRTNLPAGYVTDFTANPFPITIGAEGRMGYFFNGYIQEVSIWNRALSATDVNLLYQNSSVK